MDNLTGHALAVFMGFFAIMNPIANTPVFLGLTANDTPEERKRVAAKALLATFVTFLGSGGLDVITRLMGLILAVIGVQMLIGGITGAIKMAQ